MKKKKLLCISLAATLVLTAGLLAACGESGGGGEENGGEDSWHNESIWLTPNAAVPVDDAVLPTAAEASMRTESGVSVHDPSIFQDPEDGKYYTFGSHFAVASSYDLISWDQEENDGDSTVLYGEESYTYGGVRWPAVMKETVNLVKPDSSITTTWAPDVEYIGGKYYLYYSLTKAFGSAQSAIARLEADSVLGPYTENTIIIDSTSNTDSSGPNCIDPELFYDKDGNLWMVYGSFFGGVYILSLDPATGLPYADQGNGTLLWKGGYSAGVEGPFVFYNATTEYYYLMVSEGDLNTVYNMRVARSKNPNGPYVDVTGADVASAGTGNKIAGNYRFDRNGNGSSKGFAALGHNSVIKDEEGRYFVVYHARSFTVNSSGVMSEVSSGHNLTVSQLYFNEEGWPVMAPTAYVGESAGLVSEAVVAGDYDVVLHSVATVEDYVKSENYTFEEDGTVKKDSNSVGSWTLSQGYYVTITISGVEYKGVFAPGWDMYAKSSYRKAVYTITAVSAEGRSLWALAQ